ncbi:MAG TPA: PAS domain-containing sensor histidine kinase [Roseiflexaceae bacterium]|nr:PAS domain-containing sensor histidine kinase [Roseiflexaceae bacterium]
MEQPDLPAAALEQSLEDLYENAPCGYISTLPDGTFAKINRTFLTWTGYPQEALLGKMRFQDLLTLPGKIFYETHYAPLLLMQGAAQEIAFDLCCANGHVLPVFVNVVLLRDPSGSPLLHRTTIFDARDRREYERELQQARNKAEQAIKLRDQFLSLAAHELRTPLASILGNLQLLQRRINRENSMNGRDQRTLQIIADQTNRLNKMINSLLDVSRLETGQLSIEQKPVDLCTLLHRLVDEVQATLEQREIELQYGMPCAIIQGDELRLEQVFQNLVQNALKYSPPTSPVRVTIQHRAEWVDVEVCDQGIGIPADELPKLFQRFYRASNTTSSVSGMGIGLHVVKEIVGLHGGQIAVQSVEGEGATFTVSLLLLNS